MSQFESQFESPGAAPERKTSGLAITALISSLIFFCPVTTFIGPVLGLIALFTIGSNPAKKGKGLAMVAIILGVLFTAGWAYVGVNLGKLAGQSMEVVQNGPNTALAAGFAGDMQGFRDLFHGAGATATDAEVQAFLGELTTRYGTFSSAQFNPDAASQPQFGQPFQTFNYTAVFDQGAVDVQSTVIFADQSTGEVVFKLGDITAVDPDRGDLTFPAGS